MAGHEHFPEPGSFRNWNVGEVSRRIEQAELWPAEPPEHAANVDYRLWAFESAALDLALRQTNLNLGEALGRTYEPVHFAVSGVEDRLAGSRRTTRSISSSTSP